MSDALITLAQPIGWALIHSMWQGALIAMLLVIVLGALRARGPEVRYVTAVLALFLTLIAPLATVTFFVLDVDVRSLGVPAAPELAGTTFSAESLSTAVAGGAAVALDRVAETSMFWISAFWICGVAVLAAIHAAGWRRARKWRRIGVRPAPVSVQKMVDRMSRRLGLRRVVPVLKSTFIGSPVVVGWLKPVILMPAALVTGLDPRLLESIIAHELAHVRRMDNWVNLLQVAVETLLFYHPAVWWISKRIRIERELCCDDAAVAASGSRLVLASALTAIETMRRPSAAVALAAQGGSLLRRIRRLATGREMAGRSSTRSGVAGLLLWVALLGLGLTAMTSGIRPSSAVEPQGLPQGTAGLPADDEVAKAVRDDIENWATTGTWCLEQGDEVLWIKLRKGEGRERLSVEVSVTESEFRGLTDGANVSFEWPRPTGTFTLTGDVTDGLGCGTFILRPSAAFVESARDFGIPELSEMVLFRLSATAYDVAEVPALALQVGIPGTMLGPPTPHPLGRVISPSLVRLLPPFIAAPLRAILRVNTEIRITGEPADSLTAPAPASTPVVTPSPAHIPVHEPTLPD